MRLLCLALLLPTAGCALRPAPQEAGSPQPIRILILGDSISIGYTPFVREMLAGQATVARPMAGNGERAENCAGTNYGQDHIARWLDLEGGGFDVVHFNFGLHDLKHVHPETGKNSNDPDHPHLFRRRECSPTAIPKTCCDTTRPQSRSWANWGSE